MIILIILIFLLVIAYFGVRHFHENIVSSYASLLQSAAWDLVRQMENNPRHTPGRTRVRRTRDFKNLVSEIAKELHIAPEIMLSELKSPPVIDGAIAQLKNNEDFTTDFWFKAQGTRNGIQVFLDIVLLHNIAGALVRLTDHMKRQRDEFENKGTKKSPNFTALKLLLGLPTEWPMGDLPERCLAQGIKESRANDILAAARTHKHKILSQLDYKIWPENSDVKEREEYVGENVIIGMREYIR